MASPAARTSAKMTRQGQVTSADGVRLALWRQGAGRPLVLVHGSTADHTRWDPLLPYLSAHLETWAMDRCGRGASEDHATYGLDAEARDVAAVVDDAAKVHRGPVDLFGHSFGALCALEATTHTKNIRRLVLYEPVVLPGSGPAGFADAADALIAKGDRDGVVVLLLRDYLGIPDDDIAAMKATPAWKVRVGAAHTLAREDRAENAYRLDAARLRRSSVPTLLLSGEESPYAVRRSTDAVAKALPQAHTTNLPGQGHMAISAAPALVAQRVLAFLEG